VTFANLARAGCRDLADPLASRICLAADAALKASAD